MAAMKKINRVALIFVMAVFAVAVVSAQEPAPAPAPSIDKGAASYSTGLSGALICSSFFLSALAFLNH